MKVAMIGTGYVGLVSGTCFSEFGHEVICVDMDASKIGRLNDGHLPIYEPGLETLLEHNVRAGRLQFSTDLHAAVDTADAVFIAVGTPTRRGDGHADLTHVFDAAAAVADALDGYTVIITKSTVPVGTGARIREIIAERRPDAEFDVASNPEFLREGAAVEDFMRPNRVVVGIDNERPRWTIRELYRPLYLLETPVVFTSLETAETIKYAANAFLATKITFINEIADFCEAVGANVQDVAKAIGMDNRIGAKFLHAGPGYGGSCFPKDTLALLRSAAGANVSLRIVDAVVTANDARKKAMAGRIITACGGDVKGKTIAILGLTFKPNTDDMRDSPSLEIVPRLQEGGAKIRAYDPEGMEEAAKCFEEVEFTSDAYETMSEADALVILTEWNEFRALDFARIRESLKTPVLIDLRNIYLPEQVREAGIAYHSIGRG